MDIPEQVLKFKYHILGSLLLCLAIFTLFHLAPSFITILAYFWPLFLSTALFLAIVLVFINTSPPHTNDPKPVEELLHYVAGDDHHHHHPEPPSDKTE